MKYIKKYIRKLDFFEKLLLILMIIVLGLLIFYNFQSEIYFHSDMATANLLAREQIKTGSIFPKGWYYAQDIWTIHANVGIVILSHFFNNQVLMRELSCMALILMITYIIIIFCRKTLRDNSWITMIILIFTFVSISTDPSIDQWYLTALFWIFSIIILFQNSINSEFKIVNKKYMLLLIFVIIFLGISGIRYIAWIGIPLIGATTIAYLIEIYKLDNKYIIEKTKNVALIISILSLSILLGIIVFIVIKGNVNYVEGVADTVFAQLYVEMIISNITLIFISVLNLFGYIPNIELFSVHGILNLIKIISSFLIIFVFPMLIIKNYTKENSGVKLFTIFTIIHILLNLFTWIFIGKTTDRYLLSSIYLCIVLSSYYIHRYILMKGNNVIRTLTILSIMLFVFSVNFPNIFKYTDESNMEAQKYEQYKVLDFLKEKNLEYGYATYWNAYKNSVLSDFSVEIEGINIEEGKISPYYFLTSRDFYRPKNHVGNSFLLLDDAELGNLLSTSKLNYVLGEPKEIYKLDQFTILVYDYNIAEKAWIIDMQIGRQYQTLGIQNFNENVQFTNEKVILKSDGLIYGPYIDLEKGKYLLEINSKVQSNEGGNLKLRITSDLGGEIVKEIDLKSGIQNVYFDLESYKNGVEFVIINESDDEWNLYDMIIKKIKN